MSVEGTCRREGGSVQLFMLGLGVAGILGRWLQGWQEITVSILGQDLASIDIQHRRHTKFGQFDFGLGFERREDIATGINVRDTRGYLQWRYAWGQK